MSFKKKYPVENLINENEEEVFKIIDKILAEEKDICLCPDCMMDVAAIALNNLEPRYRVFLVRPVHRDSELISARLRKVEEAVRNALAIVKKSPHHNI
ncbi:MAG: late competence development ComFB family protein [Candidatus Omnitrophica bacterium]|nr:late competence development ComFB family protein [Candidatus Omnitrophota bacterium]